jgi:hypothetical protein
LASAPPAGARLGYLKKAEARDVDPSADRLRGHTATTTTRIPATSIHTDLTIGYRSTGLLDAVPSL